ncbi:hypothetical protein MP638_000750 [Amoeboaphelidium occidentale]|nr:hypothetical protein MP638_000750 [Amoeboaphelidium occidentale]
MFSINYLLVCLVLLCVLARANPIPHNGDDDDHMPSRYTYSDHSLQYAMDSLVGVADLGLDLVKMGAHAANATVPPQ